MNMPTAPKFELTKLNKAGLLERLTALPCAPTWSEENCPAERLRLELGTHQVELEAQNQELRESQLRIEEALERFSDLYNFAPVSYLSLNQQGCIEEINLAACDKLGQHRGEVLGKPLTLWLTQDSIPVYTKHLSRVFNKKERVQDELVLSSRNGMLYTIDMTSSIITRGPQAYQSCRSALVDITLLKEREAELKLSHLRLQNLSEHRDLAREEERKHLAREIHDELGQKLTTLRFGVVNLGAGKGQSLSEQTTKLLSQIDDTIAAMRRIAADLRPAVLDLGLAAALEWQAQEFSRMTGIACTLDVSDVPLDDARTTAIFRIVQESFTNILRHAKASQVRLYLHKRGGFLDIEISDNGVGIAMDALNKPQSFGISGIRERTRLLGAQLEIDSQPGIGTTLSISIPLHERRIHHRIGVPKPLVPQGEQ